MSETLFFLPLGFRSLSLIGPYSPYTVIQAFSNTSGPHFL